MKHNFILKDTNTLFYLFLFMSFFVVSLNSFSQNIIEAERRSGKLVFPAVIDNEPSSIALNTDISSVYISKTFANYLYKKGLLDSTEIISPINGIIKKKDIIKIKSINVSNYSLQNTFAIVTNQRDPLVIGCNTLEKFGIVTIKGSKILILGKKDNIDIKSTKDYSQLIDTNYLNENYQMAKRLLLLQKNNKPLTSDQLVKLNFCYYFMHQYLECVVTAHEWIDKYCDQTDNNLKSVILDNMGDSYFQMKKMNEALTTYLNELYILQLTKNHERLPLTFYNIANCYNTMSDYDNAEMNYKYAAIEEMKRINIYVQDLLLNKSAVADMKKIQSLGIYLFSYAINSYTLKQNDKAEFLIKLAAKCHNKTAICFCDDRNLNYKLDLKNIFE